MPSDLNLKKSWHTGLLKNQKKVWEEEQERLKEHQKIQKRQQELAEERTKLELLKLQYGDDLLKLPVAEKLKLNKLDWMYDDPTAKSQGTLNEDGFREVDLEFDVGKKEVEQLLLGKKKFDVDRNSRLNRILGTDVTRTTAPSTLSSLMSDDPLAKIRLEGLRKKREAHKSHGDKRRSSDRDRDKQSSNYKVQKDHRNSKRDHKSGSSRDRSHRHKEELRPNQHLDGPKQKSKTELFHY